MKLNERDVIVFQGDSVTDCGRDQLAEFSLGEGYCQLVYEYLKKERPQLNITVLNRGVSGDRVKDLAARLEEDCLSLNPTVVSILIGINDTWRHYDSLDTTSVEAFEKTYRNILYQIKTQTQATLVLCQPFVLPVTAEQTHWHEDLNPKLDVIHRLVKEFDAIYVPFGTVLSKAAKEKGAAYFAIDGVHPTLAGHELMATTWLQTVEVIK